MADIVNTRQFTQQLKNYQAGDTVVVVNGSKRKIVAHVEFKEAPEELVQTVEHIYRK